VWNGMDLYGFSALPGGEFISNVSDYRYIGDNGAFWTSDAEGKSNAYGVLFATDVNKAVIEAHSKNNLFSVRCIKDENLVTE
ncbi:FISUMP domain-containing protein, partial [Fibrobacter sp.]|uniref:FISUMP domain-containing protein n=1 Tax=Fibrobacter sp. TaxID=35828 RepID=UPI00386E0907